MSRARDLAAFPARNADSKTGLIAFFAASTAPAGWLECNGSAVSRTTYADLFAEVGTDYGVGDGTTTFNLPDLRGEFIRGWDNGRGVDAARARGSAQAQAMQSHTHTTNLITGLTTTAGSANYGTTGGSNQFNTAAINATGGAETRPRNVALLPCIKV
jgi:microcystin-dependent protein